MTGFINKLMDKRTICRFLLVLPFILYAVFIFGGNWVDLLGNLFVPLMVTSILTSALALKYEIEEIGIDAPVSKTFNFPSGISFSYPSKYEVSKEISFMKYARELELVHEVYLKNTSDPFTTRFSVDITRNKDGLTISDMLHLRQEHYKERRTITGESLRLLAKATVAGKEALLVESMFGRHEFKREVTVLSGDNAVTIHAYMGGVFIFGIGKSRQIEICRAIAQKIEDSLKF